MAFCGPMTFRPALPWLALLALAACEGSCNDTAAPSPGASGDLAKLDFKAACEHRAAWKNGLATQCSRCKGYSRAPKCECPRDDRMFSGKCAAQQGMINANDACKDVFRCANKCKPSDCGCQAACFDGHDKCRELAEAFERCTIEICEPSCG